MLPAASRLRRRADFAAVLRRGPGRARAARPTMVLSLDGALRPDDSGVLEVPPSGEHLLPAAAPLVGFAVSRAVGPAVVRNRVRRQLRHLVRSRLDELPRGSRLVVRALPASAAASGPVLEQDLSGALATVLRRAAR